MQLVVALVAVRMLDVVSILIQPEGRMQHAADTETLTLTLSVSILIQPEGRMQLNYQRG